MKVKYPAFIAAGIIAAALAAGGAAAAATPQRSTCETVKYVSLMFGVHSTETVYCGPGVPDVTLTCPMVRVPQGVIGKPVSVTPYHCLVSKG